MVIGPIKPAGLGGEGKMESGGPPVDRAPEVNRSERLAPSTMGGTAVTGHNADLNTAARRYRVVKAGSYKAKDSPMKHEFREGKIIDDANYDVRAVRAQGVRLVEIDADDEPMPEKK